ncbi:MAG: DUF2934 domain-containing protein [Candidatus Binataceae bacterium]|jgi:hypothetical protein
MDNRIRRIRERAYQIWESKGRPEGRQDEDWYEAESQFDLNEPHDEAGLEAAHEYEREERKFEQSGQVARKAEEARRAIDGPEGEILRRAEQAGKDRARIQR